MKQQLTASFHDFAVSLGSAYGGLRMAAISSSIGVH